MPRRPPGLDQCSLDDDDLEVRGGRWKALVERSALGQHRRPGGLEVRFRAEPSTREELAALVDLEQVCCSHLTWTVRPIGSELLLTIGGPDPELDTLRGLLEA